MYIDIQIRFLDLLSNAISSGIDWIPQGLGISKLPWPERNKMSKGIKMETQNIY
jgi:hypothetical protein